MATIKTRADYYKDTKYFCQYNINPSYKDGQRYDKGDCVIRAFAMAADITWLEAFDLLTKRARETYDVPNSKSNYPHVLIDFGFKKKSVSVVKGKKRMTVEDYELNERANKLSSFFQTATFGNLPDEKKELMRQQHEAMRKYLDVLGKRCALEGIVL